jgi:hypothetical protein
MVARVPVELLCEIYRRPEKSTVAQVSLNQVGIGVERLIRNARSGFEHVQARAHFIFGDGRARRHDAEVEQDFGDARLIAHDEAQANGTRCASGRWPACFKHFDARSRDATGIKERL